MTIRPRRSVLYMPGANERALDKAKTIAADALILDLEDSVAPDAKVEARAKVATAVASQGYGGRELVIRINGLDTPWGVDDLKMAAAVNPHAVLVPKVARPGDIVNVSRIYAAMAGAGLAFFPLALAVFGHQRAGYDCPPGGNRPRGGQRRRAHSAQSHSGPGNCLR